MAWLEHDPLLPELEALPVNGVVDGELVALGEDGWPDFPLLCERMLNGRSAMAVVYVVFDLLEFEGSEQATKVCIVGPPESSGSTWCSTRSIAATRLSACAGTAASGTAQAVLDPRALEPFAMRLAGQMWLSATGLNQTVTHVQRPESALRNRDYFAPARAHGQGCRAGG